MLFRNLKMLVVGAAFVASSAFADHHGQGPKFGFDYRAGFTIDDGKILETDGAEANDFAFTNIDMEVAHITAMGEAAKNVSYQFGYDMLNNELREGNVRLQYSKMLGMSFGNMKINQGGYHNLDFGGYSTTESRGVSGQEFAFAYSQMAPHAQFDAVAALHVALAGDLTVQILDDVQNTTDEDGNAVGDYKTDKSKSLATSLQWQGNFGGWMPLVQINSYDSNNSLAYSLGVKGNVAGLGLMVNYLMDNRYSAAADEDGKMTAIDAHFSYSLGSWMPWIGFHSFDHEQAGDVDAENNGTTAVGALTDNAQAITLGVECNAMGHGYVPYLSIIQSSGTFADAAGDDEDLSGMAIKLGVKGRI